MSSTTFLVFQGIMIVAFGIACALENKYLRTVVNLVGFGIAVVIGMSAYSVAAQHIYLTIAFVARIALMLCSLANTRQRARISADNFDAVNKRTKRLNICQSACFGVAAGGIISWYVVAFRTRGFGTAFSDALVIFGVLIFNIVTDGLYDVLAGGAEKLHTALEKRLEKIVSAATVLLICIFFAFLFNELLHPGWLF